ncbi:RraA family protein [Ginsengibacter hankyongi]|uniref:RraA family protein n=1 Tax=Ginsengibacter hankyongi TaxID=2607284 RepID=A0A5J5IEC7_9BACT|nr:RraA family protein [Ginsengibacter hankyongi]KAA9038066.1 RraA family protein [Ginsengibacter hankyongi]
MNKKLILLTAFVFTLCYAIAQRVGSSPEYIKSLTADWKGERFADGRPKVSDAILKRLKNVAMEEAWGYLRGQGYQNQYEGNWKIINPDSVMTGRVITAQYMPLRPDFAKLIKQQGISEGRDSSGGTNSWPINILQPGDVYVADGYGRIIDGTLIGSNLGNAIYANSQNGVIFDASVRDLGGLKEIKGFNGWIRGDDPSYLQQEMLTSINAPIRVGRAIVLPGDVVLANQYGTIFIPANLVAELVISSEVTALRDQFGFQRLKEKKYLAGQIDSRWSDEIKKDFINWINNYPDSKLPMTRKELNDYLKTHNYNE